MSWVTLLRMPWLSLRRSTCWVWSLLTPAFWLGAGAWLFAGRRWPHAVMGAVIILALWLALTGILLGALLLPAAEARHLRLPHLERAAPLSLGLNSLLVLALAVTPLAFLSGHPAAAIELSVMGLATGLLYALLPTLWLVPAFLCLPLLQSLAAEWHWRLFNPLNPQFLDVCVLFVVAAAGVSIWSWNRVLRSADRQLGWGMRPVAFNFQTRARGWSFEDTGDGVETLVGVRQTPRWLERRAELRGAGPRDMLRGVRVLLGGPYLPVTRLTLLRGLAPTVLLTVFFVAVYLPRWTHQHMRWPEVRALLAFAVVFASAMILIVGTLKRSMHLAQRWSRPSGELAVMPLLPRLGAMPEQKSRLVRVVFTRMRAWHVPSILAPLAIEWAIWHEPVRALLLLAILGMAPAAEVATVYCTFGRLRVWPWALWMFAVIGFASFFMGLSLTLQRHRVPTGGWPLFGLLGACAVCYALLCSFAGLGWRALQRHPHPYLLVG